MKMNMKKIVKSYQFEKFTLYALWFAKIDKTPKETGTECPLSKSFRNNFWLVSQNRFQHAKLGIKTKFQIFATYRLPEKATD